MGQYSFKLPDVGEGTAEAGIAERMQLAKRHIPHFTYVEEVDGCSVSSRR